MQGDVHHELPDVMHRLTRDIGYIDLRFQDQPEVIASAVLHGSFGAAIVDPGPASTLATLTSALRRHGIAVKDLRAILLTSITTILGLAPLLTETSFQAKFLIPMGISIAAGLAFATILTLIGIPCLYMMLMDAQWLSGRMRALLFGSVLARVRA